MNVCRHPYLVDLQERELVVPQEVVDLKSALKASHLHVSGSRGGQTIPCFRPMGLQRRGMQETSR